MAKDKKAKKTSEKRAKRAARGAAPSARHQGAAERPPESAEDFGHVLRRLIAAREDNVRPDR